MIGLKRHTVQVVAHCPEWLEMAECRCRHMQQACHDIAVDVQHVGSTSIPGLPAKPILDMLIGVRDLAVISDLRGRLEARGYIYRGVGSGSIGHLFVRESAPDIRTEHVHVVQRNSVHWNDYMSFRDAMRANLALRDAYAALKTQLQSQFPDDRKAYTSGKYACIQSILKQADAQQT